MAAYRSADENREPFISCMGDELGALFNRLSNECGWLHLKWGEYVALFGTDQGRLDVLNASVKGFFHVVDTTLWADILLHICRLTDDRTVGRRNRDHPGASVGRALCWCWQRRGQQRSHMKARFDMVLVEPSPEMRESAVR